MEKKNPEKPKKTGRNGVPVPSNPLGRPKGIPNKLTLTVKEAIEKCFGAMGGWKDMLEWASQQKNKGAFYNGLLAKLIPRNLEVSGPSGSPVPVALTASLSAMSTDEVEALRALVAKAMVPKKDG